MLTHLIFLSVSRVSAIAYNVRCFRSSLMQLAGKLIAALLCWPLLSEQGIAWRWSRVITLWWWPFWVYNFHERSNKDFENSVVRFFSLPRSSGGTLHNSKKRTSGISWEKKNCWPTSWLPKRKLFVRLLILQHCIFRILGDIFAWKNILQVIKNIIQKIETKTAWI